MKTEKPKSGKKWIWLVVGLVLVLAIVGVVLAMVLGGNAQQSSIPMEGRADLYWNIDRLAYLKSSLTGKTARQPAEDGLYHIRFAYQGEQIDLTTADRKLADWIDTMEVMGLELDQDGKTIIKAVAANKVAKEIGAPLYVQRTSEEVLIVNASASLNSVSTELQITENTRFYDVSAEAEIVGAACSVNDIGSADAVYVYANGSGELTHVYLYSRPVRSPLYWAAERMWGNSSTGSKRAPDESGIYHVPAYCEGELIDLKFKDKTLVDQIDKKNKYSLHFGVTMDQNGVVIGVMTADAALGATCPADRWFVTNVEGDRVTVQKFGTSPQEYSFTLPADCPIYDVSLAAQSENRRGQLVDSLGYGDRVTVWVDGNSKPIMIYVSNAIVEDVPLFYSPERMYSSKTLSTTREPDRNGNYQIELYKAGDTGMTKYTVQDKALMDLIDSMTTKMMGLIVDENNVIQRAYYPESLYGNSMLTSGRTVDSIVGPFITVILRGNPMDSASAAMSAFCQVYNVSGYGEYGRTMLEVGDHITATRGFDGYTDSDIMAAFVISRHIGDDKLYFILDQQYDSALKESKRKPDEDGWYRLTVAHDGKQMVVRTRSKAMVDKMEAFPVGVALELSGDVITAAYDPSWAYGGNKIASGYRIISFGEFDTLTAQLQNKIAEVKLAEDCVFYNVSDAYYDHKGEETSYLAMGDMISAFTNRQGEAKVVYVRGREVKGMYANPNRMYNAKAKETTRIPDAEGWYVFDLVCDGKPVTVKTQDKELATKVDSNAYTFGLNVVDGVIRSVVSTSWVKGVYGTSYSNWDVIAVNGNKVTIQYNLPGSSNTGKTKTIYVSSGTKVYDISLTAEEFGAPCTLKVGDRIRAFNSESDKDNKQEYIYVVAHDTRAGGQTAYCEHCQQTVFWNPWRGDSFSKGDAHYYLNADVTNTASIGIYNDELQYEVVLDLNGHTYHTVGNRGFSVYRGETMTVLDSVGGGCLSATGATGSDGCVFGIVSQGTLNLLSGTIKGVESEQIITGGGAIYTTATVNIYGGEIIGGVVKTVGDNNKAFAYGGAIHVSEGKVNMYGGKISGGRAENYTFGAVDADGNPVIDEATGLQQMKTNDGRGGNVYMTGKKSEFNMYGGEIVDGDASHGGNIYVKDGTFTMAGGVISGGVATNGGNAYISTNGKLITKGDALITGGVSSRILSTNNGGGNIFVYTDAAVLMEGGSITNGTAVSYGGNIACRGGELVIKDGIISGGKSEASGDNVFINGAKGSGTMFVAAGGQIVDGSVYIGKTVDEGHINAGLTGAPVIENLDMTSGAIFQMYEMAEGASVCVNGVGTLSVACEKAQEYLDAGYVKHTDSTTEIKVAEDNTLYTVDKQLEVYCAHCDKVVGWTPWRGTNLNTTEALEHDHYILVQDVKTNSQIRIGADATSETAAVVVDVCVDLNGHSVDSSSRAFAVYAGATLSLLNSSETQSFVVGGYKTDVGGVINMSGASSLNLYDGVYLESVAETFSSSGGIVNMATGTFNMYGGTLKGRSAKSGGAVYIGGGTFNMEGGLITGGTANTSGGNIFLNNGVINISGGIVENGLADGSQSSSNGGNIYMARGELNISGDAIIRGGNATRPVARSNGGGNIYGQDKTVINISGGTIENGTTVSFGGNVYCRGTLTISGGKISGGTAVNGGNIFVHGCNYPEASLNITGGIIENGTATTGELCNLKQMVKAAYNGDNIYIASATANISGGRITDDNGGNALLAFTAVAETPARVNLTVKDNAELIADLESKIYLVTGATMTADLGGTKADSDGDKIWCTEGYDEVEPTEPGTQPTEPSQPAAECPHCGQMVQWIQWDGSHLNTTAVVSGGHYVLIKDVETNNQIRIGADATSDAAAVVVDVCIDLNGHNINDKARAFAVYAGSTLSLVNTSSTESVVSAAYDRDIGGVINLSGKSVLNLYDGIRLESVAETFPSSGGVVHVTSGVFNMYGGTLMGRSAKSGGAIYIAGGTFNMYGGLITGGTANTSGGNIFLNNGVINISGGIVENGLADGSQASSNGGNIYMARGTLNISGDAIIRGGNATRPLARSNGGGNIYGQDKTVINISGGTIENGTTVSFGGNVYCRGTLTISGGKISGGTAVNGGNIFVHGCNYPDATLNITGGIIENGTATTGELCNLKLMVKEAYNGDNIYIAAATANISGGKITDDNGGNAILAFIALAENTAEVNLTLAENAELAEMLDGKVYLVSGATLTTDLGAGVADSDGDIVWHKGAAPEEPTQPSEPEETTAPTEVPEATTAPTEPSAEATEPSEPEATTAPTEPEKPVLCPHCQQEVQWIEWDGGHLNTTEAVSGHYVLNKNIDTASQIRIGADATDTAAAIVLDICIDLDGHSIYNKARAFAVYGGSTLSLVNRNETESVVTAAYDRDIGGVINLSGGSGLTGNSNLNLYDGVKLVGGADPFGRRGGVVFVGTGTFNMYGGTLVGQVSASGGAVYVYNGTFNMYGGLITGGTATASGGNIYLNNGVINIYGGIVENGLADGSEASSNGGNIYMARGELNISDDAIIRGGTATRPVARTNGGGNIYGQDKTVINISGGTIENGTTVSFGGNVYCRGTLTISGGKISGGTAVNGGNVFVSGVTYEEASLTITGGVIENGTATTGELDNLKLMVKELYNGDNVYVSSAKATVSDGEITDNDGGNALLVFTAKEEIVGQLTLTLAENAALAEMLNGKIYLVSGAVLNADIGTAETDGDGDQIWVVPAAPVRSLQAVVHTPAKRSLKVKRIAK